MAARCFLAVSNPSRLQRICTGMPFHPAHENKCNLLSVLSTVPYALSAREFSNDVQKPGNSQGSVYINSSICVQG